MRNFSGLLWEIVQKHLGTKIRLFKKQTPNIKMGLEERFKKTVFCDDFDGVRMGPPYAVRRPEAMPSI